MFKDMTSLPQVFRLGSLLTTDKSIFMMKILKRSILPVVFISVLFFQACSSSKSFIDSALELIGNDTPLTKEEVSEGLKEALIQGIIQSATTLSKEDGYYSRSNLRIPFPKDAQVVEERLRSIGLNREMDRIVQSLNQAAEDAALASIPIFSQAIKNLSIQDAFAILNGEKDAATKYLRAQTELHLTQAYQKPVENSLDKVNATKYWSDAINTYNRIPLVKDMNPDLTGYVTQKAIDGLFIMVAKQEAQIREDPLARTTDLLRKVFGSLSN